VRLLLVHNRYRSGAPSGENRVVDQECGALLAAGHEVVRFEKHSDEIAQWSAVKKATLPARVVWSRESRQELEVTLDEYRPQVVHVHNTFPLLSASILHACHDAGVPVVATFHNYRLACAKGDFFRDGATCHDCASGRPIYGALRGCYRGSRAASLPIAISISAQRAAWRSLVSAYVFISAAQRDLLRGLGFPDKRIFVAHNFVPRPSVRQLPRKPIVCYAGRLDETKGLRLLMSAWDIYRKTAAGPGLRLVIAGSGPLEREVADWAATRHSVDLLGQVSSTRCAELMSQARAVLVPSVWEETFGLVAVEAMALGVPPIASDHGSFVELISSGVDGVLFRSSNPVALATAVADADRHPELYETYGEQARKSYEQRFNPDDRLDRMLEIYRYAIANPV
jgi:glycosyltransferase involved in cell wall biosynthesis